MYEWHMDMGIMVGNDCESGALAGWRRAKGENYDNCNRITIKKNLSN